MAMCDMTDIQYQSVCNVLSFTLASMMATIVYVWLRSFTVQDKTNIGALCWVSPTAEAVGAKGGCW